MITSTQHTKFPEKKEPIEYEKNFRNRQVILKRNEYGRF